MPSQRKKVMPLAKLSRLRRNDVPASVRLVKEVRNELLFETRSIRKEIGAAEKRLESKIWSVESKISSVESKLASKISSVDAKVSALASKICSVESKICSVESKVDSISSTVHGMRVLMEEQRSENRIVLDGIAAVIVRQDRAENEAFEFRKNLAMLMMSQSPAVNAEL